jgi:hypothetical protein
MSIDFIFFHFVEILLYAFSLSLLLLALCAMVECNRYHLDINVLPFIEEKCARSFLFLFHIQRRNVQGLFIEKKNVQGLFISVSYSENILAHLYHECR